MTRRPGRRTLGRFGILVAAAVVAAAAVPAAVVAAPPTSTICDARVNDNVKKLLECMNLQGVREHQAAFQAIADANGGTRVSGSPGYDASAAYAAQVFADAGYVVTVQDFQFQTFISLSPSVLEQVAPPPVGPVANNIMSY